jgi:uncharacterized membrane protein
MKSFTQLFSQLHQEGLVAPGFDINKIEIDDEARSPWFIRILLGGSAWIASILFLVFVFGFLRIDSKEAMLVTGTIMCILGIIFSRNTIKNEFLNQLVLVISFAGQVMFIIGLGEMFSWFRRSDVNFYLWIFLFEAVLIAFNRNFLHIFVSGVIAIGMLYLTVYQEKMFQGIDILIILTTIAVIFIWFSETLWIGRSQAKILRPIGYACTISLLFLIILPSSLGMHMFWLHGKIIGGTISKTGIIVTAFLLAYMLLHHYKMERNVPISIIIFGSILLIAIPSWQAPGILIALIVLVLGFYRGNRVLIGLALPALAFYLSAYYYSMQETLLTKSIYLMATGAAMLLARYVLLRYFWSTQEEIKHA